MLNDEAFSLSVVVPAFNEEATLPELHRRLTAVLATLTVDWEILYVNDGSRDRTLDIVNGFDDPRVAVIDLSRNFGKEIAMTAGLDHARSDAVVVIDADLQDPPELIPEMVRKWKEGFDVVFAKRTARDGETFLKKATAKAFYGVLRRISEVSIPEDVGDFRLLSRRAVAALHGLRERHRFMKGLFAWIGYPQAAVYYRRDPRYAGKTKLNYRRLWSLAVEGITSFSTGPLKLATYIGILTAIVAFIYVAFVVVKTILFGDIARGYPSMMAVILFLGGMQLMCLGMIGEYLGRMYNETKHRPLYLIKDYRPSSAIQGTLSGRDVAHT